MTPVEVVVDGEVFTGFAASPRDGLLRVISRYGSKTIRVELPLPLDIQAEMALTEIVTAFKAPPELPDSEIPAVNKDAGLDALARRKGAESVVGQQAPAAGGLWGKLLKPREPRVRQPQAASAT